MYNFIFMKNDKLELLLNKVVEYNNPTAYDGKGCNFKGFLYKDSQGYYIKVIEHISGTDIAVNDKIRFKLGDDEFIIHAEKPKLMVVDKNSWHYQLVKYVLGDNAPTPQTMQNGCPYFWLLIFSLFACSFLAIFQVLKYIVLLFPKGFVWCLEKSVDNWIQSLDDITAYEIYQNRYTSKKDVQKLPLTAKVFFDTNDDDFFNYFLTKKYGEGAKYDKAKKDQIYADWDIWRKEVCEARDKCKQERYAKEEEQRKIEEVREAKRAAKKAIWDARMKPLNDSINNFFVSFRKAFIFKGDTKTLIKRTKQVIGALITLILLVGAFFVVEYFALALMIAIDALIKFWYVLVAIIIIAAACGLLYFIGVFIGGWLQNVINKYNGGKKVWYVEPLIWFVWYPVKYIGLGLFYAVLYIIGYPVKFIFYTVLWNLLLVNLAKLIWGGLCSVGRGLANSTGVFGEYVHADYTGLCPGLEWRGFDEEEKK
jgi:hypothetical protein